MSSDHMVRRSFLVAASALALGLPAKAAASAPGTRAGEAHLYSAARSAGEWRALLTATEYEVLREGRTEFPFTSPLWNETRLGLYRCRGCDLPLFDADWKVQLDKGWPFFRYARDDAFLTRPESLPPGYGANSQPGLSRSETVLELHCRRCASHVGHLLPVESDFLHCVNGIALKFESAGA